MLCCAVRCCTVRCGAVLCCKEPTSIQQRLDTCQGMHGISFTRLLDYSTTRQNYSTTYYYSTTYSGDGGHLDPRAARRARGDGGGHPRAGYIVV